MSTHVAPTIPRALVAAVLLLTLLVLGLGGAIVAVKLRPADTATATSERTIEQWQQAVEHDPKSDAARVGLGLALLDADRASEARTAFETALDLNGRNWMASFQLGLLLREDQPKRALQLLGDAGRLAPMGSKAVPWIADGDLLLARGDAADARDAYRRSIVDVPYLFDSHLGLAKALENLGQTKAAIEEYRAAGRFDPGNEEIEKAIQRLRAA